MTNDTAVFDAVRLNIRTGSEVWTGRIGTPEAIRRDGLLMAANSDIARTNGSTSAAMSTLSSLGSIPTRYRSRSDRKGRGTGSRPRPCPNLKPTV
jgi:hypothetical protein